MFEARQLVHAYLSSQGQKIVAKCRIMGVRLGDDLLEPALSLLVCLILLESPAGVPQISFSDWF